jgi:hypothetical protein
MRVSKLNDEEVKALRTAGFGIADDKESATCASGEITIDVIRPDTEFSVDITLPGGRHLHCFARRRAILEAGEVVE